MKIQKVNHNYFDLEILDLDSSKYQPILCSSDDHS